MFCEPVSRCRDEQASCAFCQIKAVRHHRYLISGSNDFHSYFEDLPFDVVLPQYAEYLCKICARLMLQRKHRKEKLQELEGILIRRYNGDHTANRLNKEPEPKAKKRQNEQPSFDEEPPNKVAIVSAGSIKRVYDIIHQPPVQPNKYKYLLPKYDIQLEGKNNPVYPTPVRIPATGNVLHCANGMQKSLVATRHIENLNIPASSSPRVPNSNLVNSTDTKGAKHSNISTQKCPQNQNIEKVNVAAPTSSSKLPQEKSIIGLYKIEKTSSNINKATQQSPELQNKEQIKVVPIMTTGKILNKPVPVNSEEKEKKTNAVAVKSPVVPNSQQIKIVSTSTDKQVLNGNKANAQQIPAVPTTEQVKLVPTPTSTTQPTINKSDSSKGNTTYSFNLEAVKGCLRVSDQNCSKILTNTLQDPTNIGHIKTLDIQSTSNNETTPQAPSLCPNSEHVNRLNIPLSISPATAPGKFVKLHDNKGIVFPFVHHPTSVKIIIDWSTTTKTNDLAPDLFSIAVTLSKGIYKQIALSMWRHPKIRSSLMNFLLDKIERQGCAVCGHGRKEKIKGGKTIAIQEFIFYKVP